MKPYMPKIITPSRNLKSTNEQPKHSLAKISLVSQPEILYDNHNLYCRKLLVTQTSNVPRKIVRHNERSIYPKEVR